MSKPKRTPVQDPTLQKGKPGMSKMQGETEEEKKGAEEGDDTQDEEEQEDMDKCGVKKGITEADLQKSLDELEAVSATPTTRKQELLSKAQESDLTKAEKDELFQLMGSDTPSQEETTLTKSVTDGMGANDSIKKALDVSDYLDAQHQELIKALGTLSSHVESSDARQHEFNLVLAKAMKGNMELVKAMSERLGVLEEQPAYAPMSKGINAPKTQPLQKGFAGQRPSSELLTKQQTLDTMSTMLQKSMDHGQNGLAMCGEDLVMAISKFEQTQEMSKSLADEVKKFWRQQDAQ